MIYDVEFRPRAQKDLDKVPRETAQRVLRKIQDMRKNLHGDVKQLTNFEPEYRLRVGDYRVLFEVDQKNTLITIYRVRHRSDAYER